MHELSLAEQVIALIDESAGTEGFHRVRKVAREVGASATVVDGDQQTSLDAGRITGVRAVQINTGKAHLDALRVQEALDRLALETASFLFIEKVSNLV